MEESKRIVRLIKPEEVEHHLKMLERAYGHWGTDKGWENKYRQPGFKPEESIINVEEGGQWIGGGTAWFREALLKDNKKVKVYMPGDLFTLPEHNGKGVYSTSMRALNKLAQKQHAVLGITFPSLRGLPYKALPKYGFHDVFHPRTKIKLLHPEKLISLLVGEKIGVLAALEGKYIKINTPQGNFLFEVKESELRQASEKKKANISIKSDFTTLFRLFSNYQGGRKKLVLAAAQAVLTGKLWVQAPPSLILKMVRG